MKITIVVTPLRCFVCLLIGLGMLIGLFLYQIKNRPYGIIYERNSWMAKLAIPADLRSIPVDTWVKEGYADFYRYYLSTTSYGSREWKLYLCAGPSRWDFWETAFSKFASEHGLNRSNYNLSGDSSYTSRSYDCTYLGKEPGSYQLRMNRGFDDLYISFTYSGPGRRNPFEPMDQSRMTAVWMRMKWSVKHWFSLPRKTASVQSPENGNILETFSGSHSGGFPNLDSRIAFGE